MSLNKRVSGDFNIESIGVNDAIVIKSQNITIRGLDRYTDDPDSDGVANIVNTVTIDGNLNVTGNTQTIDSTNTSIVDTVIVLNSGEIGPGISTLTDGVRSAGIQIDRGDGITAGHETVGIRFNDDANKWEATDNGILWYPLNSILAGGFDLVADTSPQLGADLDVNNFAITSASNGDIIIVADGTGLVKIDQSLSIKEQVTDETPVTGYNTIYTKTAGQGGTGIYVANDATTDELVSKTKALLFSLIF
jgi:hypothetical protein